MGKSKKHRADERLLRKAGRPHRNHERIWAKIADRRIDCVVEVFAAQKRWPDWFRWTRHPRT
jgi:hypothetical protein